MNPTPRRYHLVRLLLVLYLVFSMLLSGSASPARLASAQSPSGPASASGGSQGLQIVEPDGASGLNASDSLGSSLTTIVPAWASPPTPRLSAQAVITGASWTIETVDGASGLGSFNSLVLDSADHPHVSYHDYNHQALKYAHFDGSSWITETVDNSGWVGEYNSLALSSSNIPHISYYDSIFGNLKHAYWHQPSSSWISETVDIMFDVGEYTSIGVDGSGDVHISYYAPTYLALKYAHWNGSSWISTTLDSGFNRGTFSSLALEGSLVRISYYNALTDSLRYYAEQTPGPDWFSDVNNGFEGGEGSALALSSDGTPHVSYYNGSYVRYAYYNSGMGLWQDQLVDTVEDETSSSSIAVDGSGHPHIAYVDSTGMGSLMYAYHNGSSWMIQTVVSGNVGGAVSLDLDSNGYPHISFLHDTSGLMHAWLQPCTPSELVDINGPSSVVLASSPTFTATVLPPTTTVPISFTWQYDDWGMDYTYLLTTTEHVFTFPISTSVTGTRFLTVSVGNCAGARSHTREVVVEPPPLPDLYIVDTWPQGNEIHYQILNQGEISVTRAFTVALKVDGSTFEHQNISVDLQPGQRVNSNFSYVWSCSGLSDTVILTADFLDLVSEQDETNNIHQSTWQCDTQSPGFTWGPTATTVTSTTAVIEWSTNELSDSAVQYGKTAGEYTGFELDPTDVLSHEVTLTGLTPSTQYHYTARSTDLSGHQFRTEDLFFETAPGPLPAVLFSSNNMQPWGLEIYGIKSAFVDRDAVDHVTYYHVDESSNTTTASTDYSPDADGRFLGIFNPHAMGFSPNYFFRPATVTVEAVSPSDDSILQRLGFAPQRDSEYVDVEITSPPPDYTYYITSTVVGPGTVVSITAYATEYKWQCRWNTSDSPIPTEPPDCGSVALPVDLMYLAVDGSYEDVFTPDGDGVHYTYAWDISGFSPGQHTLLARARDSDDQYHEHQINFEIELRSPSINVERQVTPMGNYYHIQLLVENQAGAAVPARISRIVDSTRALQVAPRVTSDYYITSEYDPDNNPGHVHYPTINFLSMPDNDYIDLAPGESILVEYDLVPVIYETPVLDYRIGIEDLSVHYGGSLGRTFEATFNLMAPVTYWDVLAAIGQADYVLVTHPEKLYAQFFDSDVDVLLTNMAGLAVEEQGVLGYLTSGDPGAVFDALIEPGGAWANQLHPDFNDWGGGYVLIVGESEIVPGWTEFPNHDEPISFSDQRYSNVGSADIPARNVGRIVGNSADELLTPVQNTLRILRGTSSLTFDRSNVFLLTGAQSGQNGFEKNINWYEDYFTDQGADVTTVHAIDSHVVHSFPLDYEIIDAFAAGDVDGDGWDEIVVADMSDDYIYIYSGDGSSEGSFTRPGFSNALATWDRLAVADVGEDAAEEIIIADWSNGYIWIYRDDGSLFDITDVNFGGGEFAVGDANDDGVNEFIVYPRSDDHITGYALDETVLYTFERVHGSDELLTVADVIPGTGALEGDEIVVADLGANTISLYSITGAVVDEIDNVALEVGDTLASGNVTPRGHDEILFGDASEDIVFTYRWNDNKGEVKKDWQPHMGSLGMFSGIAAGNVISTTEAEIIIADSSSNQVFIAEYQYCDRMGHAVQASGGLDNADILLYRGHGSSGGWGCGFNVGDIPDDFGSAAPFALGTTCLSGNYEGNGDNGFVEAVMSRNGIGFVGSTQVSSGANNYPAGQRFFELWDGTRSLGEAFLTLETEKWITHGWRYWVYEYNYYGDPKFGTVPPLPRTAAQAARTTASTTLPISIPPYTVTHAPQFDEVEIPGGQLLFEEGEYAIPFWYASYDYPAGQMVQDVALVGRSGLTTEMGLSLPIAVVEEHPTGSGNTLILEAAPSPLDEDWHPDSDLQYEWTTQQNPDGTSTLHLQVYPFHYHPLRTEVEFYRNFTFTVDLITSTISAQVSITDAFAFPQGDEILASMWVSNTGPVQDVIVDATVLDGGSGEFVAGLPLRNLHDLSGWGSVDLVWDSSGYPEGTYSLRVDLRDSEGHLLYQTGTAFQLGITSGDITSFSATPTGFQIGDTIDTSMVFSNTGTVSISGTAVIKVQTADGVTVTETFTHSVVNLMPGADLTFEDAWDTTGAAVGDYRIMGYVIYNNKSTAVEVVDVSTMRRLYLPLILRNSS